MAITVEFFGPAKDITKRSILEIRYDDLISFIETNEESQLTPESQKPIKFRLSTILNYIETIENIKGIAFFVTKSCGIALNCEYLHAENLESIDKDFKVDNDNSKFNYGIIDKVFENALINDGDEISIIPPVSSG